MYPWRNHAEAVLGTVYLYFAYGRNPANIPAGVIRASVDAHQDRGQLDEDAVRAAVSAVRKLDGGPGLKPAELVTDIWDALAPLRHKFPP
jgi:hypothetical protein